MRRIPLEAQKRLKIAEKFCTKIPCTHTMSDDNMPYNVQEAVEDWVFSIFLNEIDNCLPQLELKRQGTMLAKLDRLTRWVLGVYGSQEFIESEGPADKIARRKSLRGEPLAKNPPGRR